MNESETIENAILLEQATEMIQIQHDHIFRLENRNKMLRWQIGLTFLLPIIMALIELVAIFL